MKHPLKWFTFSVSFFLCSFLLQTAMAGGFSQLPRALGPFELGMSGEQFEKLSGLKPEPCPICIKNENFATLNAKQVQRHVNSVDIGEGVDFFFYENKLYHIAVSPANKDVYVSKQEFSQIFGADGKLEDLGNGTVQMKWEDSNTVLTLNYRKEANEVFAVNYFDWNAKEERDWRESLLFENNNLNFESTANLAGP
ncbi:MAG: hypothetical protein OEZ58_07000 [Gammaproteobacteria bacterium]|nr:hypothetical protein [Gammaproteobacteria bacterium]MDH5728721.1 hypothetical protein [Gammaproteobacteria bacterium]